MTSKQLGNKLKEIRENLGLKLEEASKKIGIKNYQTLISIENGEREIKASELYKFSKAYFTSIPELLNEKTVKSQECILWRNAPEKNKKKQLENKILFKAKHYHLLEELLEVEKKSNYFFNLSLEDIRENSDIDELSEKTRKLLSLGNRPAFSLQKILEQKYKIKILFESIPDGSALTIHSDDLGDIIVINSNEAPWRRNFDLAHELFHLMTIDIIPIEEMKNDEDLFEDIEKKADNFAAILLIPEDEFRSELNERLKGQKNIQFSDIVDIALDFGVSTQALLYRMANLRMFKWEKVKELLNDSNLEINKNIRSDKWGEKPQSERFISLSVRCLRKGLISRGKFAEMVNIDRCDIDSFIFDTGLMEEEGSNIEIMAT